MKLFLALTCSMLLLYSCKLTTSPKSSGKFAPLDPNADNYALIFGAPNDLKGVSKDVAEMENLLNNSGYGYRVITNSRASKADILKTLGTYSAKISEKGTLLIYFSGHGTEEGEFLTDEGPVQAKPDENWGTDLSKPVTAKDSNTTQLNMELLSHREVLAALREGRTSGGKIAPIKFLITIIDACFSGTWNNPDNQSGNASLVDQSSQQVSGISTPKKSPDVSAGDLRSQVNNMVSQNNAALRSAMTTSNKISGDRFLSNFLTVAAAKSTEKANDDGALFGGRFTYYLRKIFEDARRANMPFTFQQWLDKTFLKVQPAHHISYLASSKNVLAIDLFSTDRPSINDDETPIIVNDFDFSVSSFLEGTNAKFKISKIVHCSADSISWSINLATGESCRLANGPCNFRSDSADVIRDFPEPRRDFDITGSCGSLKPVTYRVRLSSSASDQDNDGIPNAIDKCAATKPGASVEKIGHRAGCSSDQLTVIDDADQDGIPNKEDQCPYFTPAGAVVEKTGPRKGCSAGENPEDQSGELQP